MSIEYGFFGHPEVKNIGLLMLLYAGTAYCWFINKNNSLSVKMSNLRLFNKNPLSIKYTFLNMLVVKKLIEWSQSAGNFIVFLKGTKAMNILYSMIIIYSIFFGIPTNNNLAIKGTSETLRNETASIKTENIKSVSIHVPKHFKPVNDEQFGHYLAGLIDGDGHFSKIPQLVIVFHSLDVSLAYFIKSYLGYGNISKIKDKNAYILVLSSKSGIVKVLNLINGKLRTKSKYNQVMNNVLANDKYFEISKILNFKFNESNDLKNHWLSGFSDADASFQIKLLNRKGRIEVRLNYQVDQKSKEILNLIQLFLGGNIGYRKSQDTYYYGSTSFGSAKKVIHYFDHFHLLSSKHINYLKWRKAYLIIQDKIHRTENGLEKIKKLKFSINRKSLEVNSFIYIN